MSGLINGRCLLTLILQSKLKRFTFIASLYRFMRLVLCLMVGIVSNKEFYKHFGVILVWKLTFEHHLRKKISKANIGIWLISRSRKFLHRDTLLAIYMAFVRTHIDYGDVIYDNPGNASFSQQLESIQYSAALEITGCIRGTSRDKLYCELGLEALEDRRFCRRLCFFYNIVNGIAPSYLLDYLPEQITTSYGLRTKPTIYARMVQTERYRNTFFPFCISEWNKLDCHISDLPTISSFKRALFKFFRPSTPSIYKVHDPKGFTFLTRLRFGFSNLKEHKSRHNFLDTTDPFCSCRTNSIETTEHYILQCSNYSNKRLILFNDLLPQSIAVLPYSVTSMCRIFLYDDSNLNDLTNHAVISAVIKYIVATILDINYVHYNLSGISYHKQNWRKLLYI